MKQCKITVLEFDKELFLEFGVKKLSPCPMHHVGQIFYTTSDKPPALCDEAWQAISGYVVSLAQGGVAETSDQNYPRVATCICNCSNGLRPVIFNIAVKDN